MKRFKSVKEFFDVFVKKKTQDYTGEPQKQERLFVNSQKSSTFASMFTPITYVLDISSAFGVRNFDNDKVTAISYSKGDDPLFCFQLNQVVRWI